MGEKVFGAKCTSCGTVSYPRHAVCPNCRAESFEDVEIAGKGKVLTYTDVYALAIDYETRYLRLAIVELDEGLRVTGQLLDDDPKLGKRVKTTIGVVREQGEREIHGLQFVPV
ncbi:MAG: zinc ribbon domain-containing protein [Candidatus Bipolaricaulia bacterium]